MLIPETSAADAEGWEGLCWPLAWAAILNQWNPIPLIFASDYHKRRARKRWLDIVPKDWRLLVSVSSVDGCKLKYEFPDRFLMISRQSIGKFVQQYPKAIVVITSHRYGNPNGLHAIAIEDGRVYDSNRGDKPGGIYPVSDYARSFVQYAFVPAE